MAWRQNIWLCMSFVCGALLLSLSLATLSFWFLCVPGIALVLFSVDKTRSLSGALFGGLMVGFVASLGAISWFWYSYPLTWLESEAHIGQILVVLFYWINVALYIGIGFPLFTGTLFLLKKKWGVGVYILVPILLTLSEVFCSLTFSLLSFGPGAYPNVYFSFHYLGYLVAHIEALYPLIAIGGVYALSFYVAMLGTLLFFLSIPRYRMHVVVGVLIQASVLCALFFYGVRGDVYKGDPLTIATVDTSFSSEFMGTSHAWQERYTALGEAVATALTRPVDIVLLPEDARLTLAFGTKERMLMALQETEHVNREVIVVDSARIEQDDGTSILRAFYYDLGKNAVYTVDKQYLVPQGEFVPYATMLFLRTAGFGELLAHIKKDQNYRPGPITGYESFPEEMPGILFCFDGVSPVKISNIAKLRGSDIILYPLSHAKFHNPTELTAKLDTMIRVQALWNGKSIVGAANEAVGKAYRSDGSVEVGVPIAQGLLWTLREYSF